MNQNSRSPRAEPDKPRRVLFISGATSFNAGYFLYSRADKSENFIALLRRTSESDSMQRLQHRLEVCAESHRRPFRAEGANQSSLWQYYGGQLWVGRSLVGFGA